VRTIETHYLIDYENVHSDGLTGCENLGKTDHIVIFFTKNAKNIDMNDIYNHGGAKIEMIKVPAGKQSADIHIASYLGYLVGKNGKNCNIVIVSKDTDYDNVINFWKEKAGIGVSRVQQIKKKSMPKVSTNNKKSATLNKTTTKVSGAEKTKLNQETMQALRKAGFNASVANKVAQIATSYYGGKRLNSEVHNALREKYTNYLDIYDVVKPVLSKYANVSASKSKLQVVSSKDKTVMNTEIMRLLSKAGYSNDIITCVASAVVKNLGAKNGKQQTYRAIISKYGQNRGLSIYNHIKKHI
jgi:hypothetical protein